MKFVGYKIWQRLMWTSGEGFKNTNKIIKQGITKININKTSPSSTLDFCWSPHTDTCDILSEYLVSHRLQECSSKNKGGYWGIYIMWNQDIALDY